MASKLIRHYGRGHLHFITFTCYQRLPLLRSARARNIFVQMLSEARDRFGFSLVGYVVMPEHIHLLISEPARGTPSTVVQMLKQRISRRLRRRRKPNARQMSLNFQHADATLPRFWQRTFALLIGDGMVNSELRNLRFPYGRVAHPFETRALGGAEAGSCDGHRRSDSARGSG